MSEIFERIKRYLKERSKTPEEIADAQAKADSADYERRADKYLKEHAAALKQHEYAKTLGDSLHADMEKAKGALLATAAKFGAKPG